MLTYNVEITEDIDYNVIFTNMQERENKQIIKSVFHIKYILLEHHAVEREVIQKQIFMQNNNIMVL